MSNTKNYSLYIPEKQKETMRKAVSSGKYSSEAEYIRSLIREDTINNQGDLNGE